MLSLSLMAAEMCLYILDTKQIFCCSFGIPTRNLSNDICADSFFAFGRFFNDTPDTGFHEPCTHSWFIVGKSQTHSDCPEKADLKRLFSNPYPVCNMCLLDYLCYLVVWQSIVTGIIQGTAYSLLLE
uniref:Uncharacterized protein n=1 Tax=Geospiza parvula TaxID=87175 RepID=A0A8U8AN13_GEOPR